MITHFIIHGEGGAVGDLSQASKSCTQSLLELTRRATALVFWTRIMVAAILVQALAGG